MEEETKQKMKKRGKSILSRVFFSRTMITFLLIILQLWFLVSAFMYLRPYFVYIYIGSIVLSVFLIVYITNINIKPEFKLIWMLPVCALPVLGVLLYLFVLVNPGTIGLKKQLNKRKEETKAYLKTEEKVSEQLKEEDVYLRQLAYYLQETGDYPTYNKTTATYYPIGEKKWSALLEELEKAEHYIFMEYFIISIGEMWNSVLDVLKRKAAEGIEVRVMFDGSNTVIHLPYNYKKELTKYGIKANVYAPIKPLLSTKQNNRDHRKIVVIDGKVAFTGGINLSDEYVNKKEIYGHWKDVGIKLEGDAVRTFCVMFLQMWNLDRKKTEDYGKYIKYTEEYEQIQEAGKNGYIIPYGDDPTNGEDIAENVYTDIISHAKNYVHIMTPYLIIDNDMVEEMTFAAQKGVDVSIIMPHIPDKKLPFNIARTFYPTLIKAGVKIYEYTPGFVHAKSFVSDDKCAVIGSINLDYRSLYHHFECGVYVYNNNAVNDIEEDFLNTIKRCQLFSLDDYRKIPIFKKFIGHIFKIYSPLL